MFLHGQQYYSTASNPSMAQTAIDFPINQTWGGIQMREGTLQAGSISNPICTLNQFIDPGFCPVSYCEAGVITTNGCHQLGGSRKRGREDEWHPTPTTAPWWTSNRSTNASAQVADGVTQDGCCCYPGSSFGSDIAGRMHKELQELDLLVLIQTEKVRAELEQKRRKNWGNLLGAVEGGVQRVLRGKEEELETILRRNTALEERVRLLLAEGQSWRALAQTNEVEVASLKRDLDAALAREGGGDSGEAEDASSCHSEGKGREEEDAPGRSWCMGCRRKKVSVLALPCRHLCLCSDCDSTSPTCPVCMAAKTASLHVNLS